ncbi:MAG: zinc-binding dehydrogenase [Actinobacteria bacterium]|nr:zinc-binding dehydrogenase [Actinomycetota bacterium]
MTSTARLASSVGVMTFDGPGAPPVLRSVPRPRVPSKGMLIRIEACGVCGTDLHILRGHWPGALPWPITLGHELAGVVDELGAEFTHDYLGQTLRLGDRVIIPPLMACGACAYCVHYPSRANRCLNPTYYGRKIGFARPPHLWGGWAEMVYLDLEAFPATKVFRLPDDMPVMVGTLVEPFSSVTRAFNRAASVGSEGFKAGDAVVIQGSGPIGVLAVIAARQRGAGKVVVVGAPETPRLALCRAYGADATVSLDTHPEPAQRIAAARAAVGGFGADLVLDCAGAPHAGPEGIEMLRDGGTYVEMGQFTDAGSIPTSWHRVCTKEVQVLGSWAFTPDEIGQALGVLHRLQDRYDWSTMQRVFPLTEAGVAEAIRAAMAMEVVKATIVPGVPVR